MVEGVATRRVHAQSGLVTTRFMPSDVSMKWRAFFLILGSMNARAARARYMLSRLRDIRVALAAMNGVRCEQQTDSISCCRRRTPPARNGSYYSAPRKDFSSPQGTVPCSSRTSETRPLHLSLRMYRRALILSVFPDMPSSRGENRRTLWLNLRYHLSQLSYLCRKRTALSITA